jgi:alcohol dehydrogenase class IV
MLEQFGDSVYDSLSKLADIVGIQGATNEEKAKGFIAAIYGLNERMNIPKGFTQIKDEDIDTIVERAMKEAHPLYPVPRIFDKAKLTEIVKALQIKE